MLAQFLSLVLGKMLKGSQPKQENTPIASPPTTYFRWLRGEGKSLGKYFNSREFECRCGTCQYQIVSIRLIEKLDTIRESLFSPVRVTSGYRCRAYQETLRKQGLETATGISQHELGNAADITCIDLKKLVRLEELAAKEFDAIGVAKSFLHVDLRQDKKRRWTYG